jgi:phosphate transport system permease protein
MVLGTPVAIGIALFISHYAPRRIAGFLGYIIDLLAAVPSIVFGLWGIIVMRPLLLPLADFLNQYFGWIPLFQGPVSSTGSTMLAGGVVLAVMILPIVTSITREIFLQTPRLHEEPPSPSARRDGRWCASRCSPTLAAAWCRPRCSGSAVRWARRWRSP